LCRFEGKTVPRTKHIIYVVLILFFGCTRVDNSKQSHEAPSIKLRLNTYIGDVSALVYIAKDKGYFNENGLDVDLKGFPSGKQATDDMLAGNSDVVTAGEFVTRYLLLGRKRNFEN
jgi:NitT/TauT family transport system substrate-binding protein